MSDSYRLIRDGAPGTFRVMRPSQNGEEPQVFAEDFESLHAAEDWMASASDTHCYLPYVEAV